MDVQLKIVIQILAHADIKACIVGEVALNYYNVPRVVHDIEICVPAESVQEAASKLQSTGLFERDELSEFNLYTEYKRGFPRLRAKSWSPWPCTIVLFSDTFWHLNPLSESIIKPVPSGLEIVYSLQILDTCDAETLPFLTFPRLAPLVYGLAKRYIETDDAMAMIGLEQVIDGTDLDTNWYTMHLNGSVLEIETLVKRLISKKGQRLDEFSGNIVTCYISDQEEAQRIRRIPGYG